MAKTKVEMLLGLYEWPDGRSRLLDDGTPRLSNREILRTGDYSIGYKVAESTLFQDPYFLDQMKLEMARREKKLGALTPYDPDRVATIRDLLFDELETRLRGTPESFTRAELLNFAAKYEELSQRTLGSGQKSPANDKMQQFNAFISRTVNVMNGPEKESLVNTASEAADARIATLQQLIDESNVMEGEADDLDVTDAEISPVDG